MTSPLITLSSQETGVGLPAPGRTDALGYWRRLGSNWLLVLGHLALLTALYAMLSCFGIAQQMPTEKVIGRWDAGWYQNIRDNGYSYVEGTQSSVAFFPLFPYLWRATRLGGVGISILNMLLASGGLALLTTALRCSRRQLLLLASVPLLMFTLVPYTEALFYLFGALLLLGLNRRQPALLVLGIIGCCLTRAAAAFFVPALVYAQLMEWLGTRSTRPVLRNLALGLAAAVAGIESVNGMQYAQTGVWLAFYKAQRSWQHEWRWPQLPLTSTAGLPMLWLDGLSLGVALVAGLCIGYLLLKQARQFWRHQPGGIIQPATSFSLVYCVLAIIFTVFQQGGDIANSSRYLLGSPFFAVVLWEAWQKADRWSSWVLLLGALGVVAKLLGFPAQLDGLFPGQAVWYFGLLGCYAGLLLLAGSESPRLPWRREIGGAVYTLNLVLLAMLLSWFLGSVWLG